MSRILDSLAIPVLPAPMAGGPTTPQVVNAAAAAGSLGTLAWGTSSVAAAQAQAEELTTDFFGINLFAKQPELDSHGVEVARNLAAAESVELKPADYSNGWNEKIQLALSMSPRPRVVSGQPRSMRTRRVHVTAPTGGVVDVWYFYRR